MNVPYRAFLEQMPGGFYLVKALQQIVDTISVTPISVGDAKIHSGNGSPLNVITGNVGDLYVDKLGTAGKTLFVKESGAWTSTGWTAK
ncbi:MAG: hypothetical protein PVS2B1_21920 [Candidatus Dormibacteraceae bacterium]